MSNGPGMGWDISSRRPPRRCGILIETARRKHRKKHGGGQRRLDLTAVDVAATAPAADLLALDEALSQLAAKDPGKAELVRLRFFAGLTSAEAATCLGISRATADRHWAYARAWLYDRLRTEHESGAGK